MAPPLIAGVQTPVANENSCRAKALFYLYQYWPDIPLPFSYLFSWQATSHQKTRTEMAASYRVFDHRVTHRRRFWMPVGRPVHRFRVYNRSACNCGHRLHRNRWYAQSTHISVDIPCAAYNRERDLYRDGDREDPSVKNPPVWGVPQVRNHGCQNEFPAMTAYCAYCLSMLPLFFL